MEVNCAGCAGCCLDWRPLLDEETRNVVERERSGVREPIDDAYNFVALTRDEVRAFIEAGHGPALTPRLWHARADDAEGASVEVDGIRLAAIGGRPAFFVGLRKPSKPVAPFDQDEADWLPTCVFLDPTTLQCRIYDTGLFPSECSAYPAHNLALAKRTECERVEDSFGGNRLLDSTLDWAPEDRSGQIRSRSGGNETADRDGTDAGEQSTGKWSNPDLGGLLLGPQAIGAKLFAHPWPEDLEGRIRRISTGKTTQADRTAFVAVAAASSPGTVAVSEPHYEAARERLLAADDERDSGAEAWSGPAIREWKARRTATVASDSESDAGTNPDPDPRLAREVEEARGAPTTPGWDDSE